MKKHPLKKAPPMKPILWEGNPVTVLRKIGRYSIVRLLNGIEFTVANIELKRSRT